MAVAIASAVTLGLGIALNPVAIIASILVLRGANARTQALALLVGWIIGLALLFALTTQVVQLEIGSPTALLPDMPAPIWIAVGAILLVAAGYALRRRPSPGSGPESSRLLRAIDRAGTAQKIGAGIALSAVSLRNLALLTAASAAIAYANLAPFEQLVTVAIFVAVSSLGVLAPLLVQLFGGENADARLESWRRWLNRHMGTFTAVVLIVCGGYLLLQGLRGLLS